MSGDADIAGDANVTGDVNVTADIDVTGTATVDGNATFNSNITGAREIVLTNLQEHSNDSAAAGGGVPLYGLYRDTNGNVKQRIA